MSDERIPFDTKYPAAIKKAEQERRDRLNRYHRRGDCLALAVELWSREPGQWPSGHTRTRRVTQTAEEFERWLMEPLESSD